MLAIIITAMMVIYACVCLEKNKYKKETKCQHSSTSLWMSALISY